MTQNKKFIKHMSKQLHKCDKYEEFTFSDLVGYLGLSIAIGWILRWPILFIIFLITG